MDDTGFAICENANTSRRTKLIVAEAGRIKAISMKLQGSVDCITVIPVVLADVTSWNPDLVIRGAQNLVSKTPDGRSHTLHEHLPFGAQFSFHGEVVSMDTDIFVEWAKNFLKETQLLGSK